MLSIVRHLSENWLTVPTSGPTTLVLAGVVLLAERPGNLQVPKPLEPKHGTISVLFVTVSLNFSLFVYFLES